MSGFEIFSSLLSVLYRAGGFILSLWWIYIPLILAFLAKDFWLKYKRNEFINNLEWIILEVRPPGDLKKTPYAMEQFFAGLHGTQSDPNWKEQNIKGEFQKWFSMELVSLGGEVRFFIRTLKIFRNIVESNIYAHYPESEILQADDYTNVISAEEIKSGEYDLWGSELELVQKDCYPIRTYYEFEKEAVSEEQRVDSIASLLEVATRIGSREQIWIQTLIRPIKDDWKEAGDKERDELIGRKKEEKKSWLRQIIDEFIGILKELITGEPYVSAEEEKKQENPFLWSITKNEQEIINSIEKKTAKLGYETIIRIIYFGVKEDFSKSNVAAIIGAYKQLTTQNLNAFKPNKKITSKIDYSYQAKETREFYRKERVLADYKKRNFTTYSDNISYLNPLFFEKLPILKWFFVRSNPFVLNVEELATVYHFPGEMVKAPLLPKVEAKKGEPPIGLPLE